ncbi:MAG: GGDEF domain-containing protein [bacterium]
MTQGDHERTRTPFFNDTSLLEVIGNSLKRFVFLSDHSPVFYRMFHKRMKSFAIRRKQVLLLLSALLVGGFWIEDFLTGKSYELILAYATWRPTAVVSVLIGAIGLEYWEVLRRYRNSFYLGIVTFCMALGGYLLGSVKGTEFTGFYYMAYLAPMYTIVLCVGLTKRILAAAGTSAAFLTTYLLATPVEVPVDFYLHYFPYWIPVVTVNAVIGHAIYQYDYRMFEKERELKKRRQEVERLANQDQLTSLLNRTHFTPLAEETFERAQENDEDLSLIMLDLDHFKNINDTYGHLAGDRVLSRTGKIIDRKTRDKDVCCRFGGEEFCILMPGTDREGAERMAERIKREITLQSFDTNGDLSFSVTCSMGVSELNSAIQSLQDLIRDADAKLYEAKNQGRDEIVSV